MIIDYTLLPRVQPFVDPRTRKTTEFRGQFKDMEHFSTFANRELMMNGRTVGDVVVVDQQLSTTT